MKVTNIVDHLLEADSSEVKKWWENIMRQNKHAYAKDVTHDWGSGGGQGKRIGQGMVRGGMSDMRGKQTVKNILAKAPLSKADREEASFLGSLDQELIAQGLKSGLSFDGAMLVYYAGTGQMTKEKAFDLIKRK